MQIVRHVSEMASWSETKRRQGRRIAFVPTMGFLHEGHLSLVRHAKERGDCVVVSIFVNPTQFAPTEDFTAYPRDLSRDNRLLQAEAVDVLFHPPVEEIYPTGCQTHVEVETLSKPLCGMLRPAHFRGVATVVTKLFNIVRPHAAIFGEKDYQQLQIIRRLVRDLMLDIEIIGHPIVREADGVAMSSRNAYLNAEERKAAVCLSRSLRKAECMVRRGEASAKAIIEAVGAEIKNEPLAIVEYIKIGDLETLDEVDEIRDSAVLALAVRIGKARLIDNKVLIR
ncbi:MAG: pantoate--beta-alanine ligase [Deltaproteobacteria bacterium]|nr:pantoate--beta-alanine ligase [Deltaproteobacteria bacterium]